ncbi:hypothetical protein B566_EDAN005367 [Ephemera danica]|nr:hypothetical protein B566_EDAN005367 [Ephemera danica]
MNGVRVKSDENISFCESLRFLYERPSLYLIACLPKTSARFSQWCLIKHKQSQNKTKKYSSTMSQLLFLLGYLSLYLTLATYHRFILMNSDLISKQ